MRKTKQMLTTHMQRMRNNILEIRIAGSYCRPQICFPSMAAAWQDTSPEYLSVKLESIQKGALKIVFPDYSYQ